MSKSKKRKKPPGVAAIGKNKVNDVQPKAGQTGQTAAPKDVSLGPACGVVFLLGGVVFAIIVSVSAYLLIGKQGERASSAIREQLIPWVDESELSVPDKARINERLMDLAADVEAGKVTDRQLGRLRTRLTQNPVLQWGVIDNTIALAQSSGEFTDAERRELQKISDRLLMASSEFKISMEELGFLVQKLATRDSQSGLLETRPEISHSDVITFMQRSEELMASREVGDPPENSPSVAQVFEKMINDALDESILLPLTK